ncbi:MAG TPA: hypothetical protein VH598_00425 [Verrucomicrobiae bacterium]|nr:hypothetical protein [Verrucomicrobiae bacterium]
MPDCCAIEPVHPARALVKCRECGETGRPVATITLKQMVLPRFLEAVSKPGFRFCASPGCDVVYFHPDGQQLRKRDLRARVGLKETEDPVPLCYCFDFTRAMVVEEIRATGNCSIPARIAAELKAGNCACETRNPQGSCCLGNVTAVISRLLRFPSPVKAVPRSENPSLSANEPDT